MKVEILEETGVKHVVDGELKSFSHGDVVTVPDAVGEYFCSLGWAKDVDGKTETGERNTDKVTLTPAKALQTNAAKEVE